MATSLFALLDDIASLLDDIATMTKVATKKTAGVLGDDLALNAEQVGGVRADRELPIVWAVAKGSAKNKVILVPAALAISAVAPWLIPYLLMVGGSYLCFEGAEKLAHKWLGDHHATTERESLPPDSVARVAYEKTKVSGAVRTDFILSAEIIVIALGTVTGYPFLKQAAAMAVIAAVMTIGVYGLVAGIVKLDDAGLALSKRESASTRGVGRGILYAAPYLMKGLSLAGTVAMFLVGGGILVHNIPALHHKVDDLGASAGPLEAIVPTLANGLTGLIAGAVLVLIVTGVKRVRGA